MLFDVAVQSLPAQADPKSKGRGLLLRVEGDKKFANHLQTGDSKAPKGWC
jgi:hypothetical protein